MFESDEFNSLESYQFKNDPRIEEAKKLLVKTLKDHQTHLTGVQPPKKPLEKKYHEILEAFDSIRGGKLYFPYLGSGFGNGALVELMDGSVKYDMISGIGPHYWGHSNADLLGIVFDAILNDTVMQGHLQQNIETYHYAELLVKSSGLDHCFFSSSGAMANENALKIIFQKKHPAHRLLAFDKCFIGRTLSLSQITDKPGFREELPQTMHVDHIPYYDPKRPEESTKETLHHLHMLLKRHPKQHAVMVFELVQGEGGFHAGTTVFFEAIMKVLKEHGIAIFIDEVQTFGRTNELFAFQHFHLEKYVDVVSIGKLSQVCATLFRSEFKPKPGLLSQTFTSSTTALYAGYYIVKQLLNNHFFGPYGKIEVMHQEFLEHFKKLEQKHPGKISGPYGIGSMIAFTPFDGEPKRTAKFVQDLFHSGVISFTAGSDPTRVRFLVPIGVLTSTDISNVVDIVEKVLENG